MGGISNGGVGNMGGSTIRGGISNGGVGDKGGGSAIKGGGVGNKGGVFGWGGAPTVAVVGVHVEVGQSPSAHAAVGAGAAAQRGVPTHSHRQHRTPGGGNGGGVCWVGGGDGYGVRRSPHRQAVRQRPHGVPQHGGEQPVSSAVPMMATTPFGSPPPSSAAPPAPPTPFRSPPTPPPELCCPPCAPNPNL